MATPVLLAVLGGVATAASVPQPAAAAAQCPTPTGSEPSCDGNAAVGSICTHTPETLCPTQMSLGMVLIACKSAKLSGKSASKLDSYLKSHVVPAVIGPGGKMFITDHHHLAKALSESTYKSSQVYVCPTIDLSSASSTDAFWANMTSRGLVWREDNEGRPLPSLSAIPATIVDMTTNDPYRTVSEWVRDDYGYIKCDCGGDDPTSHFPQCSHDCGNPPFLEFIWADVVRKIFPIDGIYTAGSAEEVAALVKIWHNAVATVQQSKYSSLPHYNSGAVPPPDPPVSVDPTTGCEDG